MRAPVVTIVLVAGTLAATLSGCGSTAVSTPGRAAPTGTSGAAAPAAPPTTTQAAPPTTTRAAAAGATDWSTYGGNPARTADAASSPPATGLSERWTTKLDGKVYGEPLVVGSSVIVATEQDTVYALDATSGSIRWRSHLATPVDGATLPCGDIDPSGITGTPVVDVTTSTVWALAFEAGRDGGAPSHHLVGLDLGSGRVTSDRVADAPGSDPAVEQERGALLLQSGTVYVPYGGLEGDCGPYHGEVVGLAESGGATRSFVTPTQREGGIWSPPGPVAGPGGRILVTTGNATSQTIYDDANAVLALSPVLAVVDLYAPSNWRQLSADDLDLSSASATVLSGGRVLASGKQGLSYLLDGSELGGVGGQLAVGTTCAGSGVYGGTATDGTEVYLPCKDGLRAVDTSGGTLRNSWDLAGSDPGTPLIAGGSVFDLSSGGTLDEVDPATGSVRAHLQLPPAGTPFASLSASGSWLYAATGQQVHGITGA